MTEEQLLKSAQGGNQDSFGELMRIHQPLLFGMILRRINQREDAEDVLQEVFIQAFRHLVNFRGEAKLSTWLYTIALNRIRNHVRQKNARRQVSLDAPDLRDEQMITQLPEKGPSVERQIQHRRDFVAMQLAVEKLNSEQKSIFVMHYFQHLPLEEISRRLQKPLGTVKVYLHRARKTIGKTLDYNGEADARELAPV